MIKEKDINQLIESWKERSNDQSADYKEALQECIFELHNLLWSSKSEEELAMEQASSEDLHDYLLSMQADSWLASPENHEQYY